MTFVKNAWYAAAWDDEVTRKPLGRRLLDKPVALFRKENGDPVAIGDVCPHRFAPLHKGKVQGDALECPYHGLQFAGDGSCQHNPHGEIVPPNLRVDGYPVVERDQVVWIWMGDPDLADPGLTPDFSYHSDPDYLTIKGLIAIPGSYELVSDNLLDLSHVQYLHPVLTPESDPDSYWENDIVQDGDVVTTTYNVRQIKPTPFIRLNWPDAPEKVDNIAGVRWEPPAAMLLKVHMESASPGDNRSMKTWGAHLVTPETETTCHYFWSFARNFRHEDQEFSDTLRDTINSVFTNEDGWIIGEIQANMGGETDLMSLRPVVLPTDEPAIRARRIVRKLLKQETAVH